MQVAKQPTQSLKIYKAGVDILEIEKTCELKKLDFFNSVYAIEKIKDRKDKPGFAELLGQVLVKISVLAGIKNEIDDFTKQDISKMIFNAFNELSLEEIYKAFELERYGLYEDKTDHFQLFDANYISEILKKYKKWKIKEKQLLNFQAPKIEMENKEIEKESIKNEFLKQIFDDLKTNGYSSNIWLCWEKDLATKELTEFAKKVNATVTNSEKKEMYAREQQLYLQEINAENKSRRTHSTKWTVENATKQIKKGQKINSVVNRCRCLIGSKYLKDYLTDFEEFKKQIDEN